MGLGKRNEVLDAVHLVTVLQVELQEDGVLVVRYPDAVLDPNDTVSATVGEGDRVHYCPVGDSHFADGVLAKGDQPYDAVLVLVVLDTVGAVVSRQGMPRHDPARSRVDPEDLAVLCGGVPGCAPGAARPISGDPKRAPP